MNTTTSTAPALEATMYFKYGQHRRLGVTAKSTFEAILLGERTSTTRFDVWPGTQRWGRLTPGTKVRFFADKDKTGSYVDVIVYAVHRVNLARFSAEELENWSRAEGWTSAHGRDIGRRGPGYQIRFHIADGEKERLTMA